MWHKGPIRSTVCTNKGTYLLLCSNNLCFLVVILGVRGACSASTPAAGTFTATVASQTITSENFPSAYPISQECTWTINAGGTNVQVNLWFTTTFQTQDALDIVKIYDGKCEFNASLLQSRALASTGLFRLIKISLSQFYLTRQNSK